jgi:hypothetical protein
LPPARGTSSHDPACIPNFGHARTSRHLFFRSWRCSMIGASVSASAATRSSVWACNASCATLPTRAKTHPRSCHCRRSNRRRSLPAPSDVTRSEHITSIHPATMPMDAAGDMGGHTDGRATSVAYLAASTRASWLSASRCRSFGICVKFLANSRHIRWRMDKSSSLPLPSRPSKK